MNAVFLSLVLLGAYTDVGYTSTSGATFTGDLNGNPLTDTTGPVQLGGECAGGVSGEVCVPSSIYNDDASMRVDFSEANAIIIKAGAQNRFLTSPTRLISDVNHTFNDILHLAPVTQSDLSSSPDAGDVLYCSDCQPGAECSSGGTGALAIGLTTGEWRCL